MAYIFVLAYLNVNLLYILHHQGIFLNGKGVWNMKWVNSYSGACIS